MWESCARVADLPESFDGALTFRLTQRNRSHILYLLARMTAWLEEECGVGIGFAEYVNRSRKKPFEVEHIWADKYERHTDEFDNPHDFADHRDRYGDLLLLPKDFNASYGDKPYLEKLPHYFRQNLLAASLNPLAYEKNPSFLRLVEETGLPFKAYPDGFTKSDIEERQELYRQICEHVWSPDSLGLGGGTPSEDTTQQKRQAFYGVSLSDLIATGLVAPGERVTASRSGVDFKATILSDGRLRTENGVEFDTLSGAADSITGKSNNGWEFWSVSRASGAVEVARLRDRYLQAQSPATAPTEPVAQPEEETAHHQEDTVVVAAKNAYTNYLETSAYVCQPNRSFRPVQRIGFYRDKRIEPEIPLIHTHLPAIDFSREAMISLRQEDDPELKPLARLIEFHLAQGREEGKYDVYFLSAPDDEDTIRIAKPIPHEDSSAWTQGQRYADSNKLRRASSTRNL